MTRLVGWIHFCGVLTIVMLLNATSARCQDEDEDETPGPKSVEEMTVDELREYQAYYYPLGGRDPLTMRLPTDSELGLDDKAEAKPLPTLAEMENILRAALEGITDAVKNGNYADAITVSENTIYVLENDWPELKPEHESLRRMADEIRNLNRMAVRLKTREDIAKEFAGLAIRVEGVIWSPTDAKAVVNGRTLSAGELMLVERQQGDLRIEIIEEHGVVFQFKGMRFRIPVEVYAPPR